MTAYQIVCHTCAFQRLVWDESEAQADVDEHGDTGHEVKCVEVA